MSFAASSRVGELVQDGFIHRGLAILTELIRLPSIHPLEPEGDMVTAPGVELGELDLLEWDPCLIPTLLVCPLRGEHLPIPHPDRLEYGCQFLLQSELLLDQSSEELSSGLLIEHESVALLAGQDPRNTVLDVNSFP